MRWLNKGMHAIGVLGICVFSRDIRACASCGCTLNSDAALGYSAEPGLRMSFEYDYIHQDQLRHDRDRTSTVPDDTELERETLNRYYTLGLDYNPTADWNIDLRVPWVVRTHSTYGDFDSGAPLSGVSDSRSSSLGDLRLIGSFQGILPLHNLGLQLGVKLPTGRYGTDVKFDRGPLEGEPLDASLQPGTGSTGPHRRRLLLSADRPQSELLRQCAVPSPRSLHDSVSRAMISGLATRPRSAWGCAMTAIRGSSPSCRSTCCTSWSTRAHWPDITDTAGYVAYLSPGVTVRVVSNLHAFAFAQLPIYSDLVGYQLFPRYTASVGASYAF